MKWLYRLSSVKITLLGMVVLAVGSMLSYGGLTDVSNWVLVAALAMMATNLLCAIAVNRKINRQPGLLVFHLGLFGIVVLVAVGRLTHLDAQVELVVGQQFDPALIHAVEQGPLHRNHFDEIRFVQGPYSIHYEPGINRGPTYSRVTVFDNNGGHEELVVGDDTPLLFGDYRLYTSFNKGYAVLLEWTPEGGEPILGGVNLPSYPLNDYQQKNEWRPPGTDQVVKFWLTLTTAYDEDGYWAMEQQGSHGVLAVTVDDRRVELREGDSIDLPGGRLHYQELTMWMGYTIFYDPTLFWLFWVSTIAVLGLGWHLWQKLDSRLAAQQATGISQGQEHA